MSKHFDRAVNAVSTPVYASSRADVVDLYIGKYGADKWTGQIVKDILAQNAAKRGDYVQTKKEATTERNSVRREFQYDKRTGQERYKSAKIQAPTAAKYVDLGKKLPPVSRELKGDQIKIVITGKQKGNHGRPDRNRTLGGPNQQQIILSGETAKEWVNNPTWKPIWDAYGFDFGIDGDGDIDADYTLTGVSVSAS